MVPRPFAPPLVATVCSVRPSTPATHRPAGFQGLTADNVHYVKFANKRTRSKAFGFSQAVRVTGARELLVCSGQTALGPDGSLAPSSDMGDQVRVALDNVVAVLAAVGMSPADIVKTTIYTTDVDATTAVIGPEAQHVLGSSLPSSTLVGVTRLAFPELKVEIEVTAAR
jgi:enamine deaminase RidA (YjgF/YER057c/UK114 family)